MFFKWYVYVFLFVFAMCVALEEIQIEGKFGWAKNLPTWRHSPDEGGVWKILSFTVTGGHEITGYHLWHTLGLLLIFHLPFLVGISWSLGNELKVLSILIIWFSTQDFLWFALNDSYPVFAGGFNAQNVSWHQFWGPVPRDYVLAISSGTLLALVGDLISRKNPFQFAREFLRMVGSYILAAIALAACLPKNWKLPI